MLPCNFGNIAGSANDNSAILRFIKKGDGSRIPPAVLPSVRLLNQEDEAGLRFAANRPKQGN